MKHILRIDNKTPPVKMFPKTVEEEVLQNVQTILSTPKGSVPLDRNFGVDLSILDRNMLIAENLYMAEIVDVLEEYEPRAAIESLELTQDTEDVGTLIPYVEVKIIE